MFVVHTHKYGHTHKGSLLNNMIPNCAVLFPGDYFFSAKSFYVTWYNDAIMLTYNL